MSETSLTGRVERGSFPVVSGYEAPKVSEIGALTSLTLGVSGPGFDLENNCAVPGDDYEYK